jgi:hypothetical protein
VLCTHMSKDYISTKMTLDNCESLANPMKHMQNV